MLKYLVPYTDICTFFFLVFVYLVIFAKDKEELLRTISMYLVLIPLCSNVWPFDMESLSCSTISSVNRRIFIFSTFGLISNL